MRIHTGFHRFTEIGQIFYSLNIYIYKLKLSKMKSGKWSGQMFSFYNFRELFASEIPGKGKSKKIPEGACPGAHRNLLPRPLV